MKIAIFSTNIYPTPLREGIIAPTWIAHYLTEGLVKKGHEVFLFGSSDSETKAKLISGGLPSLSKNKNWSKIYKKLEEKNDIKWKGSLVLNYELILLKKLYKLNEKENFDIIQLHNNRLRSLFFASFTKTPVFYTLHDRLSHPYDTNLTGLICSKIKEKNIRFISISDSQRKPNPNLNYASTVYNGIDINKFSFNEKKGDYLVAAGRILPWKGFNIAIKVAQETGEKLKIAGTIPPDHKETYWDKEIKPHLSEKITYEGVLNQNQMVKLYKNAKAFLMPIDWEEPFGLVMTESMACGTPVIAFNRGSVPELIKDGETGFIVKDTKEMIEAVKKIDQIDRKACRKRVEENFTIKRMVDSYEKTYQKILKERQ